MEAGAAFVSGQDVDLSGVVYAAEGDAAAIVVGRRREEVVE